jgi:threonine dehydrogenase-like Zn-dependent dehydrogenase
MKALIFRDIGEIALEEVDEPKIEDHLDAIVKITTSSICGTDLHLIRGTVGPIQPGTILGHEAVGIVEEVAKGVRNLQKGDRVIVPSTIACGYCYMCREGHYSQCNKSNPNGPQAGTAFFGGPKTSGPLQGCQTEYVRVPFASSNLVKIPDVMDDNQAILLSDTFPTAYFGADIAEVKPGSVVVVLGCGSIGQFCIASCLLKGASRIFAVDAIPSRLMLAKKQGAETINFNEEDPVSVIKEATEGILADIVIDAVGVDAYRPTQGPAAEKTTLLKEKFNQELDAIAPKRHRSGDWVPGDAPEQALLFATKLAKKTGTISIIGVYPKTVRMFPIGEALHKNLKLVMGNCPHKYYIPQLLQKVVAGLIDPRIILTHVKSFRDIVTAYDHFNKREEGWIKVALKLV